MQDDRESPGFLERAYKVAKLIAITTASIAGFVVSLVALDVTKGHWWVDVKIPLYALVFTILFVTVLCAFVAIVAVLVARDARSAVSFYKNKAKGLEATISALREMAYTDPITGIPNSNKLKKDIDNKSYEQPRCLILLDLENFGEINKKYNHSIGDEYLRRFAQMVSSSSRRNEFLFKKRPLKKSDGAVDELEPKDEVKAFRKNSGGDEFYILLEGTIIDGLGYLNRLLKRKPEFEQMSFAIMKARHPFGFCAGVVSVGYGEVFETVNDQVSQCLGRTSEEGAESKVAWFETQMPERMTDADRGIIAEAKKRFRKGTLEKDASELTLQDIRNS